MMETVEEEKLIAAARLIMTELDSNKKLSYEARKILVDLRTKLSEISEDEESEDKEPSDIEKQLDSVYNKTMIGYNGPDEIKEYLKAVEGVRRLVESLESLNPSKNSEEHKILMKATNVLHISIHRIEGLFKRILVHNRYNFVPRRFQPSNDDGVDKSSIVSYMDDSVDDSIRKDGTSKGGKTCIMHLINPEVIPDLKSIAILMFGTNHGRVCCSDAFISIRKDALDDLLFILEIEKSNIEDVLKMERVALNSKIKRWTKAMRIFVRIYLASEKFLCEQIFGQGESISSLYFSESSKASILQFLNFAEAFAIGPHEPEKILTILGMHDALADLTPDIKSSYPDENGSYLRTKFQDVLIRVGNYAGETFFEFMNAVRSNMSIVPFPKGGIHHFTRHVMNYITTLVAYGNSLNTIFIDHGERDDQDSSSLLKTISALEVDSVNEISSLSPMELHFRSLMSILESNLVEKSRLYKDDALGHLFLMNNVHYMSEKVKGSKLRTILGDDWIREHNRKFQQYAMSYERSTWSPILKLFIDEGLSLLDSKTLHGRLWKFYPMFEKIYKSQTGWLIPNIELRNDMRISISTKVVHAYRTFVGRFARNINKKYIKYSPEDLENYLLDLFEGSAKSL